MSKIIIALLIVSCLANLQAERTFFKYTQEHNKVYTEEEYSYRLKIFSETLDRIEAHNSDPSNTWFMGLTEFTDWTEEEFAAKRLSEPQDCSATRKGTFKVGNLKQWLPTSVDWRAMGVVTPVKNQGQCGSCWAFSTTGALESHWAITTREDLPLLSEQQLVDCAGAFNNQGCNGGLPSQAFEYIMYAGGLTSEDQYPYTGKTGTCKTGFTVVAKARRGSYNITYLDEGAISYALAFNGPVSIAFQVISGFKDYNGGVYNSPLCSNLPDQVNHAVLAVGYGVTSAGQQYYIVKNSWGVAWGTQGYFLLLKGVNMCGVADCAAFPLVN